ncbi:MAG: KTSC domain-containing protein [Cyclobacteriaceae bacterium]
MERTLVTSTTLRSVGYDTKDRILELEFTSGAIYQYYGVAEQTHEELLNAESLGEYLNYHIKPQGYEYQRIV